MKRRTFLGLFGVSAISLGYLVATGTQRNVEVGDVSEIPDIYPVDIDVAITEPTVTDDHPPSLRITITNTGENHISIGDGSQAIFSGVLSGESNPGIQLIPPRPGLIRIPGRWQPIPGIGTAQDMSLAMVRLEPGERKSIEYEVWEKQSNSVVVDYPTGEFTFSTTYHINNSQFDWGFTLSVK